MTLPAFRYRGPFWRDDDQDQQSEPDQDVDDQNLPPPMPDMQFMPASPEQIDQYDPNLASNAEMKQWLEENVFSKGWTVDAATGEIYDPETDTVKGKLPTLYPRT